MDFVILKEDNSDLKDPRLHNKTFVSISFSVENVTIDNYDEDTLLKEQYDVMNRIKYLIDKYPLKEGYVYLFGTKDYRRLNMYKYFIAKCFPDYKLIKDYTSHIDNVNNIGYYLIK